jgi:hypothetical protein
MAMVQGVLSVIVGRRNFSTVVGEMKLKDVPESIRVDMASWSLVCMFISKRGDIFEFERHTNSRLLLREGPIWV